MVQKPEINQTIPLKIQYLKIENAAQIFILKDKALIELKEEEEWQDFDNSKLTFSLYSNLDSSNSGLRPLSGIQFSIPGDNQSLNSQLLELANAKLIFKITLADGQEQLLGTQNKPCFISIFSKNQMNATRLIKIETKDIFRYLVLEEVPAGFSSGFSLGFNS